MYFSYLGADKSRKGKAKAKFVPSDKQSVEQLQLKTRQKFEQKFYKRLNRWVDANEEAEMAEAAAAASSGAQNFGSEHL